MLPNAQPPVSTIEGIASGRHRLSVPHPGAASTYHYRALVPLAEVTLQRRPRCVVIQAHIGNGRVPSTGSPTS
ncbi:hypothetical protein [Sphingobium xenophagum]